MRNLFLLIAIWLSLWILVLWAGFCVTLRVYGYTTCEVPELPDAWRTLRRAEKTLQQVWTHLVNTAEAPRPQTPQSH